MFESMVDLWNLLSRQAVYEGSSAISGVSSEMCKQPWIVTLKTHMRSIFSNVHIQLTLSLADTDGTKQFVH